MKDDLISRKAAIDRLNAIPPGNWSKARYTRELWNVPSVGAVPLDKLCEMLSKFVGNPPCPCGYDLKGTGCNPDWEKKDCWKIALTTWMEENK